MSENAPATPASNGAPAGHDAAMAAKFDAAQSAAVATPSTPASTPAGKPANVPDKFWDAEKGSVRLDDLLNSYTSLEGKLGGKQPAPVEGGKQPPAEAPAGSAQASAEALAQVGLDYNKYAESYAANGKLSDADYAEMAAKNIPRAVVDAHIAALVKSAESEASALRSSVFEAVGGEESYGKMSEWAKANVPKDQLEAYNRVVDSGDINSIRLAVSGLHAKYTAAVGSEPNLLGGSAPGNASGDVFKSTAQLVEAMKDPRYSRDPAYRAEIEARLARSNNFF